MLKYDANPPHIIKYMGSKKGILDFVISGINEIYNNNEVICDLFAGSSILSGALRNQISIVSNDIQTYSAVLANTYLANYSWDSTPNILDRIIETTQNRITVYQQRYPDLLFQYSNDLNLEEFNELEKRQQELKDYDFGDNEYHLFMKYYSGTYWSYEQCMWIDVLRSVANDYINTPIYYAIISSLMFAMSYSSQSTGHFAQYRDATNITSMQDILTYRTKEILTLFLRKFTEFQETLGENRFNYIVHSMDYINCLQSLEPNTIVYADPPYCFVHYSRFYHAFETLVKYDYPQVQYKGRYRSDRHQSPFCIRTKVAQAFKNMFTVINERQLHLVLSYSNTGMIELDELLSLAINTLGNQYDVNVKYQNHTHSTMGRRNDKSRSVQECLVLAKRIG